MNGQNLQHTQVHITHDPKTLHVKPQIQSSNQPQERVRIFVALFDYDPVTMSPNPDSAHEELPFREGQLIKVYGEKDADGFYWGEASHRSGYVPCNMVSEVQVDDDHVAADVDDYDKLLLPR